ncbi:hypothetical protein E4T44_12014 [Aureobasidium sp. EXF-8845]|nr:hypothetical protein E4T45_11845 [Aureobasidium sp. EXF-8846]KAI4798123.1 hypothetical protein E4T44_12014 [Aureobasidium sp. EXF-8845]
MEDESLTTRPLGPRNLPRASHACQRCRLKKGRCNQQHPCSSCVRAGVSCLYGEERRKRRRKKGDLPEGSVEQDDTRLHATPRSAISPSISTHDVAQDGPREPNTMNLTPEVNINSVRSVILEGTITSNDRDVVGDVNQRTQGTEFYGTSSNYVLLNQLFSHARQHSIPGPTSTPGRITQTATNLGQSGHSPAGRMSLVNLLANEDDLLAPSRDKSPIPASSTASQPSALRTLPNGLRSSESISSGASPAVKLRVAERRLERVLIRSYMHNLHHLHPMIDTDTLNSMCDEHLAQSTNHHDRHSHPKHFYALYSIVAAVGALVAGSDVTDEFGHEIKAVLQGRKHSQDPGKAPLQGLSRLYFRKSRSLLGDVFEACSLESAQTLLLMASLLSSQIYPRLISHSLCTVRTR